MKTVCYLVLLSAFLLGVCSYVEGEDVSASNNTVRRIGPRILSDAELSRKKASATNGDGAEAYDLLFLDGRYQVMLWRSRASSDYLLICRYPPVCQG